MPSGPCTRRRVCEYMLACYTRQHKQVSTLLQVLQVAGTLPVKELYAKVANVISERELQDGGKKPCSLLSSTNKALSLCNHRRFACTSFSVGSGMLRADRHPKFTLTEIRAQASNILPRQSATSLMAQYQIKMLSYHAIFCDSRDIPRDLGSLPM